MVARLSTVRLNDADPRLVAQSPGVPRVLDRGWLAGMGSPLISYFRVCDARPCAFFCTLPLAVSYQG